MTKAKRIRVLVDEIGEIIADDNIPLMVFGLKENPPKWKATVTVTPKKLAEHRRITTLWHRHQEWLAGLAEREAENRELREWRETMRQFTS